MELKSLYNLWVGKDDKLDTPVKSVQAFLGLQISGNYGNHNLHLHGSNRGGRGTHTHAQNRSNNGPTIYSHGEL
ncbi:hypothetical protein ACO22_00449 [Paracoccidioides brasiliensis]|uniref:Uncharacterized protein n=1 Tax=Paracoccidioides brasiliensis TaxID=121759 RepID=A0A1D2JPE0_PARBR|nr:hypothetical protein ACO22_00449 [Paracoccidioides brasiliensis]